tara:strand:- start:1664 stop:2572 length:909 start_codon:yes stop_codon:yes gene_type:complete
MSKGKKNPKKLRARDKFDPLIKYNGEIFDCVVLDASNIVTTHIPVTNGEKSIFAVERLPATIQAVQQLGWPTFVGMKKKTYEHALRYSRSDEISESDRNLLKKLVEGLQISLIDNEEDDLWLWKSAMQKNGWVLSHDSYNKEIEKYTENNMHDIARNIRKRRVWLEFVGNEPTFTLPMRDSKTIIATRVNAEQKFVADTFDEHKSVIATLNIEGQLAKAVSLKIGEPIGRKELQEVIQHEELAKVSGSHFRLDRNHHLLTITDLNSTNGTAVGGITIPAQEPFIIDEDSEILLATPKIRLNF